MKRVNHFPGNWQIFGKFASNVPNEGKSDIFLLFNCPKVLSSLSNKANFFAEIFFKINLELEGSCFKLHEELSQA